jgi:hypothetical protein
VRGSNGDARGISREPTFEEDCMATLAIRTTRTAVLAALIALPLGAAAQSAPSSTDAGASQATQAPASTPARGPIPSRSETAMEAFGKLNRANAGYLTWDDVRQLDGFETAFQQADQNRDGRLNPAEFNSAWAMYTGSNP